MNQCCCWKKKVCLRRCFCHEWGQHHFFTRSNNEKHITLPEQNFKCQLWPHMWQLDYNKDLWQCCADWLLFFFFTCNSMTNVSVILTRVAVQGNTFVEGTVHSDNSTFEGHTSLVRQAFGSITVGPKRRTVLRKTCCWWALVHIWNSPGRNNSHHSTLTWLSFSEF